MAKKPSFLLLQKEYLFMEFNVKLQELRKQKGLTQEELAAILFVSRTAISKWESGRGYPNIDSLKAIAEFFSVSVDKLLSGDELLDLAKEETKQKGKHFCDLIFGLLDISVSLFLFLPLFGQKSNDGIIRSVLLLNLTEIAIYLKIAYFFIIIGIIVWGILTLAMQNSQHKFWLRNKNNISLLLNLFGTILLIISSQPYGAILLLVFLVIKVMIRKVSLQ